MSKNKGGRPRAFNSPEELEAKIKDYFDTITITYPAFDYVVEGKDEEGKDIVKKVPRLNNAGKQVMRTDYYEHPTILGMCRHLDMTRETLCNYSKEPEFIDTIKKAKAKIEDYLEHQLHRKDQVTGIIFNLKNNFGWKDKHETEITGKDGGPIKQEIDLSKLSIEELKLLEKAARKD